MSYAIQGEEGRHCNMNGFFFLFFFFKVYVAFHFVCVSSTETTAQDLLPLTVQEGSVQSPSPGGDSGSGVETGNGSDFRHSNLFA